MAKRKLDLESLKKAGVVLGSSLPDGLPVKNTPRYRLRAGPWLRAECRRRGLSAAGTSAQLRLRLTDHDEATAKGDNPTSTGGNPA